jgi:hypothetical protein
MPPISRPIPFGADASDDLLIDDLEDDALREPILPPRNSQDLRQIQTEVQNSAADFFQSLLNQNQQSGDLRDGIPPMGIGSGVVSSLSGNRTKAQAASDAVAVVFAGRYLQHNLNKIKPKKEKLNYIKGIVTDAVNTIGGPLGYNNPTVEVGSPFAGQRINSEALNWIIKQEKIKPLGSLDAMGGLVKAQPSRMNDQINISFRNPVGYGEPSNIQKQINKLKTINPKEFESSPVSFETRLSNLEEQLEKAKGNPLMPEAIRYQLGRVIENAPIDTLLTAEPIGGYRGARARIYKSLSKGALETQVPFKPDYSRMPSEDEFRSASEGGGARNTYDLNTAANQIKTKKVGPQEFININNKTINWSPEELKDPMLRAAFNLDEKINVSALRSDLAKGFLNERLINFDKPIITPNSPTYRIGRGIVNASKVGLTDLIPSREVVRNIYNNQPLEAVKNYSTEFIGGVPQALAVGAGVAAAPALAPVAAGIGGGMAITRAANAVDEAYRQTTGKSWTQRNRPTNTYSTYTGPTPTIQPRTGTAFLGGKPIEVPYGSIAGQKTVGRPWWDKAGSQIEKFANLLNSGSIMGR